MAPLILRFGIFTIDMQYYDLVIKWLPIDIPIAIAVIAFFKLYNRVWTYVSIEDMIDCLKASVVIEAIYMAYKMLLGIPMMRSFYPFNWMILFLFLACSRVSVRLLRRLRNRHNKIEETRRLMLIGGGSAGSMLLKELKGGRGTLEPVCIIDDNVAKKGKLIHGVPIVGTRNDIIDVVDRYRIDDIIIAIPSASPTEIRDILKICQETHCKVKILPAIASTLTAGLGQTVRDVNYEDLLGRDAVVIANPELEEFVRGKTVMVTGGGGTIGSELCRQIVANKPGKLLIVDIYENTTYELEMELNRYYPEADKEVLIASVRDYDRLESIFAEYKPEIVYHAAAHKHVPLMEYSPNEAIKNNCKGTLNLCKLADKYGVKRFVLISTDKAVRPTNVMGASKRICEMIVQTYNRRSNTEFVAVRFGNVLGSNGSVIPLFLRQIAAGGPLTLTHRDITRFFMTIPEAVSLVLKAGLMARGGEIFVLDMGEPVKIYDLAVNLIKMKGYVPEKDIKIEIVGLRPGEKLYEELLMDEEGLQDTANSLIHIGKPIELDEEKFLAELDALIAQAEENGADIRPAVKSICPTYQPNSH
ncbi:MAG: polysaccharide biosynthesis protein [Clostridiales bacterium]|nr:polysaccharide biosynthesis protein [Candidatus Crickella merdequi]